MDFRVYVANLREYNEGKLVGEWLELPMDTTELREKLDNLLNEGEDDYAIHDYENDLGIRIEEYADIETLNSIAWDLFDLDEIEYLAVGAYLEHVNPNLKEAIKAVQDGDFCVWNDCHDYTDLGYILADYYQYELARLPELIKCNIDYEGIGRDYAESEAGGFYGGSYFVFF